MTDPITTAREALEAAISLIGDAKGLTGDPDAHVALNKAQSILASLSAVQPAREGLRAIRDARAMLAGYRAEVEHNLSGESCASIYAVHPNGGRFSLASQIGYLPVAHIFADALNAALTAAPAPAETAAARDVLAERRRQVEAEGWTPEHDDEHDDEDLALAAACYAIQAGDVPFADPVPFYWPWAPEWWKPTTPRRDLVKAGALILAAIERLDRLPPAPSAKGE